VANVSDALLKTAFKEWAVICRALSAGTQALILRKGGIAEGGDGVFRPEHPRFWLYPTYAHQQQTGIVSEMEPTLREVEGARPPSGSIHISSYVDVVGIYRLGSLADALKLTRLHGWSSDTVRARFAYREPGLWVLLVRTFNMPAPIELRETAEYLGCRTWVELERGLPAQGQPAIEEARFAEVIREVEGRLQPTAWV
jgi:hypothetical protein